MKPASLEADVKAVITKVALGEADAGIAYVTDVRAGGAKVQGVDIAEPENVNARYPIALMSNAKNRPTALALMDFVLSGRGREILGGFGFLSP